MNRLRLDNTAAAEQLGGNLRGSRAGRAFVVLCGQRGEMPVEARKAPPTMTILSFRPPARPRDRVVGTGKRVPAVTV
jgi:hypothetical protein